MDNFGEGFGPTRPLMPQEEEEEDYIRNSK
jgi:hypothetical protein